MDLVVGADDRVRRAALEALGAADAEPLMDVRHHRRLLFHVGQVHADAEQPRQRLRERPPAGRTQGHLRLARGNRRRRRAAARIAALAALGAGQQLLDLAGDGALLDLEIARGDAEQRAEDRARVSVRLKIAAIMFSVRC
jgi:hypothetical protein